VLSLITRNGSRQRRVDQLSLSRAGITDLTVPQNQPVPKDDIPPHEQYIVDVLLNCAQDSAVPKDRSTVTATPGGVLPCPSGQKGEPLVLPVLLSTLNGMSHLRIFLSKDLRSIGARETVWKSVLEVQRRSPNGIPLLDPIENMGIKDEKFKVLVKVRSRLPLAIPFQ
jgi:ATP-dependent RNA helicase DOB1